MDHSETLHANPVTVACEGCGRERSVPYATRTRTCVGCPPPDGVDRTAACVCCGAAVAHHAFRLACDACVGGHAAAVDPAGRSAAQGVRQCVRCGVKFNCRPGAYKDRSVCSLACATGVAPAAPGPTGCLVCGGAAGPVCAGCQPVTATDPAYWAVMLAALGSGSRLVRKPWGGEVHVVNHADYCLKYLFFFAGAGFSNHVHADKRELWHCLAGAGEAALTSADGRVRVVGIRAGVAIEVLPGVIHQVLAAVPTVLAEVSTHSLPEDSFRMTSWLG